MLIPKKHRLEVYSYLFKEGVIVAQDDNLAPSHPEIKNVPNLEVLQLMRGFRSKGLVRENYAWRHHYWYLTNEGIEYLREKLHLPATIIPATLKSSAKYAKQAAAFERTERPRGDDKEVAPAEFNPEFKGTGRGRGFAKETPTDAPAGRGRGYRS